MSDPKEMIDPAMILGVFLSIFGFCVLFAIAFTPSTKGQITNLVCGLTILLVAGGFIWASRRNKRRQTDG